MTFEAVRVEKQEVAGNEYGCVSVPSLSDSMIKACWSPECICRSVFLAPELSCSKDPKRSTMIKEHFHVQKPNPTSRAHSVSQNTGSAQSNTAPLKKITAMLLWFPTSLLLVNALHSLRQLLPRMCGLFVSVLILEICVIHWIKGDHTSSFSSSSGRDF